MKNSMLRCSVCFGLIHTGMFLLEPSQISVLSRRLFCTASARCMTTQLEEQMAESADYQIQTHLRQLHMILQPATHSSSIPSFQLGQIACSSHSHQVRDVQRITPKVLHFEHFRCSHPEDFAQTCNSSKIGAISLQIG